MATQLIELDRDDVHDVSVSPTAWQRGADSETQLGSYFEEALVGRAVVLHDRTLPDSRGSVDHIIVSATAVWVIGERNHTGLVDVRSGSWAHGSNPALYVNRRRQTRRLDDMGPQHAAVRSLTDPLDLSIPVVSMLCFTTSDWPKFRSAHVVDGVWITWPEKAVELAAASGPCDLDVITQVAELISAGLPATQR